MKRTPRSIGLMALAAATVLVPLGTTIALASEESGAATAPAANYEGSAYPGPAPDAGAQFYNGQDATVAEFPGIIAGIRAGGPRPEGQTCTGTVVAPRKILIAAHCADATGEKRFVYGLNDLADFDGGNGSGFVANVVEYKKHPRYVNFDQGYDVAVVTVDRDIPLQGGAAFPKVATSADAGIWQVGDTGLGFGYGKKNHADNPADVTLDKASLPIVDGARVCTGVGAGFQAATMICTGYADGRVTILQGDSGGPLIVDGKIVGVASWSRSDFRWYGIYGRLDNDMGDWVAQEIGDGPDPGEEFGVEVKPASGSVAAGQHLSVEVATTAGELGSVDATLSASGVPSGVQAVFQTDTVTLGESAKLTFDASSSAVNGTHEVTITARTGSGQTSTAQFSLTVTDGGNPEPGEFTLGASPSALTVAAGKVISGTITSSGTGSGIRLAASGLPSGVTAEFQPGSIDAGKNAKVTFSAAANVTAGTHDVRITGTDGAGKSASTTIRLTVQGEQPGGGDVTVTASPSSGSGWQGSMIQTRVSARGGTGSLTLSATGAPAGTQIFWNPQTIAQGGSSDVWFFTNFQTAPGTYRVTIKATAADGKSGTTTFTMTVTSFGGWQFGGREATAW
ncbi:trypsin-like serine protease [Actinokineospora sp. NPDC004072]